MSAILSEPPPVGLDLDQGTSTLECAKRKAGRLEGVARPSIAQAGIEMRYGAEIVGIGVFAFLALLGAAFAADAAFQQHMWVLFAVLVIGAAILMRNTTFAPKAAASIPFRDGDTAYMDDVVRYGTIATMFWGVVGLLVGVVVALQLAWPDLNIEPWFNFGRMRPLHTSAVIFAFGGNALIATSSFYVVQRTCRARLFGGNLAWFVFWGYQLFIVMAGTGYLLGITQGKEYAEPEWYVDLWLTAGLGRLPRWSSSARCMKRKEPHIYVANWFYLSFIVTIAMLHRGEQPAIPVSVFVGSQSLGFAGVQDAHGAVVVRPQRGGLLPDRRLPRHDVLLRARSRPDVRSIPTGSRSSTSGR
jgi:cytochrome c oxidase cbb3-type subunit 1